MSAVPITILNGFLGSGKTTILRNILAMSHNKDEVPAVIVNDMSELDVDGVLVVNTDVVNESMGNFITISGDSISSPMGIKKLEKSLKALCKDKPPAWIIIETSGSTHPLPLVKFFKKQTRFELQSIVTLVDATWLRDDFDLGRDLVPNWQNNLEKNTRGIENLLVEQILFSNQVILTKTDKIDPQIAQTIGQAIHPINPYASIVGCAWGKVSLEQMRSGQRYNFHLVDKLSKELKDQVNKPLTLSGKKDQRIVAEVINDDRPFHPTRLFQACQSHLTHGVFRSKGFFWMPSRDDVSLLWNQANGNIGLEVVGFWREPILDDSSQNFTDEQKAIIQQRIDEVDSRFGDRRCRLTVIGQEDEAKAFVETLNRCFLTDEEIEAWQNGEEFADPWPKKIAKI